MRILVASSFEAGSPLAHAINTVKMAEGFVQLGHTVTIACRAPLSGPASSSFLKKQYAIDNKIIWHQLAPKFLGLSLSPHWHFALQLIPLLLTFRPNFVYSRNYLAPCLTSFLGIPTVAESHAHPENTSKELSLLIKSTHRKSFKAISTISNLLRDGFVDKGVSAEKIIVLPDAVDLHIFLPPTKLPPSPFANGPTAVYTGHLYDYKGIPTIIEAAKLLPNVKFHLLGGLESDIKKVKNLIKCLQITNVTLHGHKTRGELPPYLWHADVLLLPPSAKHPSAQWTSPVKLGEYLASGKPLISSDIPALRAWLSDEETLFVKPDDPQALAQGIDWVLNNPKKAIEMAENGQQMARDISYEKRAKQILMHSGLI